MTISHHKVAQVKIAGITGYQVQALYRDCSDSFWEPIAHAAVFPTRERAERMLKRVLTKGSWEYTAGAWGIPVGHYTSVSCALQGDSVAVYCPL